MDGAHIAPFRGVWPVIGEGCFVAPGAVIVGDVHLGDQASVWFGCVIRGDDHHVRIGARTNVQDLAMIHVTYEENPTLIGDDVTIGHGAKLHGCAIGAGALIGIGAIVLDGAVVEEGAMVAAGTLVTPGKRVGAGELWAGNPARMLRELRDGDREYMNWDIGHYLGLARDYLAE